ncbi:MAG: DEAD/DEAH box helicase family protein [Nitrososphaeraceae archaeon]|nr:DEAD/DEAH box helicase family protein [Nitrososphaeraceae archaeon]MDW0135287.1 DEAD/DEAH box helicase family protein [Nitrososphaeraceae archaeon]
MSSKQVTLKYHKGTIVISGLESLPYTTIDSRTNSLISYGINYKKITEYLKEKNVDYEDLVLNLLPLGQLPKIKVKLRDYQKEAIESWSQEKMGSIVLPTGAGKTIIGLKIIEMINSPTLIVVPTLDLIKQWTQILSQSFNIEIGNIGGGTENIQAITVSTYDSAYIKAPSIGNKFLLIVFDEVHHLPAPSYRLIAETYIAPFRLGLTATLEREDHLDADFPYLIGKTTFRITANELAKNNYLANYVIERKQTFMSEEEYQKYKENMTLYHTCLRKIGLKMNSYNSFKRLIMISSRNNLARRALVARNKAIDIALNSRSKMDEIRKILSENKNIKTIIFTQHNKLVYDISNAFLIPFITYKSSKEEREDVLGGFKDGRYKAIVTSKVLDEGIDVPDAQLGILVSGTGSSREFVQRLGRLLRPKNDNQQARLIEIVSSGTSETLTSKRRQRSMTG